MRLLYVIAVPFTVLLAFAFLPVLAAGSVAAAGISGGDPLAGLSGLGLDADTEVVCRKSAWGVQCMMRCAEEGLGCPAGMKHPYKPDGGMGKLWKCSGSTNDEVCKYVYDNGDECTLIKKENRKICKYTTDE